MSLFVSHSYLTGIYEYSNPICVYICVQRDKDMLGTASTRGTASVRHRAVQPHLLMVTDGAVSWCSETSSGSLTDWPRRGNTSGYWEVYSDIHPIIVNPFCLLSLKESGSVTPELTIKKRKWLETHKRLRNWLPRLSLCWKYKTCMWPLTPTYKGQRLLRERETTEVSLST